MTKFCITGMEEGQKYCDGEGYSNVVSSQLPCKGYVFLGGSVGVVTPRSSMKEHWTITQQVLSHSWPNLRRIRFDPLKDRLKRLRVKLWLILEYYRMSRWRLDRLHQYEHDHHEEEKTSPTDESEEGPSRTASKLPRPSRTSSSWTIFVLVLSIYIQVTSAVDTAQTTTTGSCITAATAVTLCAVAIVASRRPLREAIGVCNYFEGVKGGCTNGAKQGGVCITHGAKVKDWLRSFEGLPTMLKRVESA